MSNTNLLSRAALRSRHVVVEKAIEIRVLKGICIAVIRNGSVAQGTSTHDAIFSGRTFPCAYAGGAGGG